MKGLSVIVSMDRWGRKWENDCVYGDDVVLLLLDDDCCDLLKEFDGRRYVWVVFFISWLCMGVCGVFMFFIMEVYFVGMIFVRFVYFGVVIVVFVIFVFDGVVDVVDVVSGCSL